MTKRSRQSTESESRGASLSSCSLAEEGAVGIGSTFRASSSTLLLPFLPDSSAVQSCQPSPSQVQLSFGAYIWNEVSILLFFRFNLEIRRMCPGLLKSVALTMVKDEARAPGSITAVQDLLQHFEQNLQVAWEVGKRHLSSEERAKHDVVIRNYIRRFISSLDAMVREATALPTICKNLPRLFEVEGYPQEENTEFSNLLAEYRQTKEQSGYSYHIRASNQLPLLPRYGGDRKSEEEHSRPRIGYTVVLPLPHPNKNINTSIQLIEPKKKRAPLDEYRIFSHPKKAATYGVEDFLVDEELAYRAITALKHHLDTFGSLVHLSPFSRFLLWNLLGCDEDAFERIHNGSTPTVQIQAELANLRQLIAIKQAIFEVTRAAAREAALHIGWCAISAQWRDQILGSLAEVNEKNWYYLSEISHQSRRALFPNFAGNTLVCELALAIVEKMDNAICDGNPLKGGSRSKSAITPAVKMILLPFLQGVTPPIRSTQLVTSVKTHSLGRESETEAVADCWKRLEEILPALPRPKSCPPNINSAAGVHRCFAFICSSMLFSLACLAQLLDLCSLVYFSKEGFALFSSHLLNDSWTCEEDLIRFLIRSDLMNLGIAPIVALPRLYRNIRASVQKMLHDRLLLYVLAARLHAEVCGGINLHQKDYSYWKLLTSIGDDREDYSDSLLMLEVETLQSAPALETLEGHRYFTEACLEKPSRVWDEDLKELLDEEEDYKKSNQMKGGSNNRAMNGIFEGAAT